MLMTFDEYMKTHALTRSTFYRLLKEKKINTVDLNGQELCCSEKDFHHLNEADKKQLAVYLAAQWKNKIKDAHEHYRNAGYKSCKESTAIIVQIEREVKHWSKLIDHKIKGFDRRSLQKKVATGAIERKPRADKHSFRNRILKTKPEVLDAALELVCNTYFQDAKGQIALAIDRAIDQAKKDEKYYEVAAINIHTLKRHIYKSASQSGFRNLHDYLNHHNLHRKGLAYNKGSFTNDIEFGQVFSMDDHKFDVAGALVWNADTGKFEQKHVYSWFIVEMKTMYPLAWIIQASPFNEEDIVRLLMKCFRQYGLPTEKLICDQGLGKSERIKEFCRRLDLTLEPQEPYCPTQKAVNERFFGVIKNECDVYNENFTGSNHPVEGRHRGRKLSPEETTEMINEAVSRYENYITGFFMDRPRKREISGIEHLTDNTGRVSMRVLWEHFWNAYEIKPVTDRQLRYAYMKYDSIKKFSGYVLKYKNEQYIPEDDTHFSIALFNDSYEYTIAYNPEDLNRIDLYASQDIIDRISGLYLAKGDYVCTLVSLTSLPVGDKRRKVTTYNKRINKQIKELANLYRARAVTEKDMANIAVGDEGMMQVAREQTREVERLIHTSIPAEKIDTLVVDTKPQQISYEPEELDLDQLNAIEL
jgi:transposase InsO family protein